MTDGSRFDVQEKGGGHHMPTMSNVQSSTLCYLLPDRAVDFMEGYTLADCMYMPTAVYDQPGSTYTRPWGRAGGRPGSFLIVWGRAAT